MKLFKEIFKLIKKYNNIIIARHIGADPDALGSQFALKELIQENFKDKNVYAVGSTASKFRFMGNLDKPEDLNLSETLLIVLDTPDKKRIDGVEALEEYENTVNDIYGLMPVNVNMLIEKKRIDILASEDKVKDIKDSKDFIDIHLSKELSNKDGIGVVLFEKANALDYKNINLSFSKDNIRIRIRKLNTNWMKYIKEILETI